MEKKILFILAFLFISFLLIAQVTDNEKVLRVGAESDIDMISPWESAYAVTSKILWNVFEPLVTLEEKSTTIKPCLATSWEVSDNNSIWSFTLRDNVKFHDGSTLTADDVIASANLFYELVAKVEKIDSHTIRFTLPEPHAGFLNKLADIMYGIAPAKNTEEYKTLKEAGMLDDYVPVGTGPFKFSHWEKGKEIVLESFADYWQGPAKLRKIIYYIIPGNEARLTALETGKVDVIDVINPSDLLRIKKNPDLKVESIFGMNVCFIAINTRHKPLDKIKVRKALNLAINKKQIIKKFYQEGCGIPTNRALSPAFWKSNVSPKAGSYRPEEAKKLLIGAGLKRGISLSMLCIPAPRPYLPDPVGVAHELRKQFAEIGVALNIIIPPSYSEYDFILREGSYDLTLAGWIDVTGDPDYTLRSLLSSKGSLYNESHWSNKEFDKKLQQARELSIDDEKGKFKLYNEAEKIFQKEAPWIPLVHAKIMIINNRKVKGLIFYPSSMISYYKATIQK
jgi:peptide/nickel transport system substrate-binding protein